MVQQSSSVSHPGITAKPPQRSRKLLFLIPLAAIVVAGGVGIRYFLSQPEDSAIELSGRIEGYESDIGAKVAGRVEKITVREGDRVQENQVIAKLDDDELQAQLRGAEAKLQSARQEANQARLQIDAVRSQMREVRLSRQQAEQQAQGRIEEAQANLSSALAKLEEAKAQKQETQAQLRLAKVDRDRYKNLVEQGVVPQQQFDQAQTEVETTEAALQARQAAVNAAQRQVNVARGSLRQAQTTSFNPEIRTAKLEGLQKQLEQARSQLSAAQSNIASAQATKEEIKARLDDLDIISPIDGVVLDRIAEPGEVLSAGKIIVSVLDLDDVYLRGYIREGLIGKVRVGQPAQVYLDSNPDQPINATVSAIDSEASFTPENIYFKRDRVTQVFGVKLALDNPQGFAKPGMPADAEIIVEPEPE